MNTWAVCNCPFDPPLQVEHIRWATDKLTGEFKGFGHVQFKDDASLEKAIALNGTDVLGRPIRIGYSENLRKRFKRLEEA